ncbi:MAG: hypothetical protein CMB56_007035 [Methanobacteriota archaeon]|nr:MAG: hypothetical protein CMB56_007035 [Euryarchaeota archaeon]
MMLHCYVVSMARCPFCMAPVSKFDEICRTCGRIITGSAGSEYRTSGQFNTGSYSGGASMGRAPQMMKPPRRIQHRRRKKGKLGKLVFVSIIACVFVFTPANELAMSQWANVSTQLQDLTAPVYPKEATYTVDRTLTMYNKDSDNHTFKYSFAVPKDRTSKSMETSQWLTDTGAEDASRIQEIISMYIIHEDFKYELPIERITSTLTPELRGKDQAIQIGSSQTEMYWPGEGDSSDNSFCSFGPCIKWEGISPADGEVSITVRYTVKSTAYSWWSDFSGNVEGASDGISLETSGTYSDIKSRGQHYDRFAQHSEWFKRNDNSYAIDATDSAILSAVNAIDGEIPEDHQENPYAFARRAFEFVQDQITYGRGKDIPRSGPSCLSDKVGDCDEQSNLWMSLLRVKEIPTWYEFGALTGYTFKTWEPHGWSNVMLPYDSDWCAANNIVVSTCYVEASVDVTNNMWLFKPPTALGLWIEVDDRDSSIPGEGLYDYFYRIWACNSLCGYAETWETVGEAVITGGTFTNPQIVEEF